MEQKEKDNLSFGQKVGQYVNKAAEQLPPLKASTFQWPAVEIPAEFPLTDGGRLPGSIEAIQRNRASGLVSLADSRHNPRNKSGHPTACMKKLKICLFFDGTNNNEEADKIVSGAQPPTEEELNQDPRLGVQASKIKTLTYPRTTNVARLYHACMGVAHEAG